MSALLVINIIGWLFLAIVKIMKIDKNWKKEIIYAMRGFYICLVIVDLLVLTKFVFSSI